MPKADSFVSRWRDHAHDAIAELDASKRQRNADYNARIRIIKSAIESNVATIDQRALSLIRAPLAGLR